MRPIDPAVKPTIKKKENSAKSLGREFTNKLIWVIWPCAPQVIKISYEKLTYNFMSWGKIINYFLFSKEFRSFTFQKIFWFKKSW